jgi:lysophospholipase L1-like esterase
VTRSDHDRRYSPARTITAYGHSWVDSTGVTDPDHFFAHLVAAETASTLINHAVGGTSALHSADLLAAEPPAPSWMHLLMVGLNDARINGPCRAGVSGYAAALGRIFEAFHRANPSVPVFALSQPHLLDYSRHAPAHKGSDALIDEYNEVLRRVARRYPAVVVVPVPDWDPHTMLLSDMVHPNPSGHRCLADAVLNALAESASTPRPGSRPAWSIGERPEVSSPA